LRLRGELLPSKFRELTDAELEGDVNEILSESQQNHFHKGKDLDFAYMSEEGNRFRVNLFRKDTGVGAVFRYVPAEVPDLDALGIPPIVKELCDYHQGMVLVTGATGSGKSTTLAAMLNHINSSQQLNVISLEDPIEFVHTSDKSQIVQREYNTHFRSFADAVRAAMRQDPDVILVGEMRDTETIRMAMTAAETGHLVLGTLHTTSAVKTLDRIIDALPALERGQAKTFLSQSLIAVITQVLVKTMDGRARKAVFEIMTQNKAISKLIMSDQVHLIPSQLQTGKDQGMQVMDQALLDAVKAKEIDPDDTYRYATDKKKFTRFVTDTGILPKLDLDDMP
ncbi:MAG: type IV pilus twitching motility protein PilT, partial [Gammaproteobacteria bacterium]